MEQELEMIGQAVRAHRANGGGLRLPQHLREQLSATARRARSAGWSAGAIATRTAVSAQSIMRWTREPESTPVARLVPVRLASAPVELRQPASAVTLISPTGWKVKGLDAADAAAFLRALQ